MPHLTSFSHRYIAVHYKLDHIFSIGAGVYIMSKSSGIMKIDSPGKIGPGLPNIDQDVIRKQILAAKQVICQFYYLYLFFLPN